MELPMLLGKAMYALNLPNQGALGELIGASRRTGQRWAVGRAHPSGPQLQELVVRVHAVDADLAADLAAVAGTTLLAMGLERPAAPPAAIAAFAVERVADSVLCAAAEAMDVSPRAMRHAILAAFTRARELGLTVEAMEKALRAGAPAPPPQRAPDLADAAPADAKKKR